jgi:iron-sulfur cluster assembly protein
MISVTANAAQQIQRAAADSGAEGMSLRVAAHYDDAAHEMQYGIGFDELREGDEQVDAHGVTLLVSPLSKDAVANLTIDFVEVGPGDQRFVFIHPDEAADADGPAGNQRGGCGSCGCGSGGCGPRS